MRDIFRDWKRKLGVLTLLMDCFLVVAWGRSLSMLDIMTLATADMLWRLTIEDGIVEFSLYSGVSGDAELSKNTGWKSDNNVKADGTKTRSGYITANLAIADTKSELCWFTFATKKWITPQFSFDAFYFVFPYWAIIVPLTALSAWLLLSKPRPVKRVAPLVTAVN